MRGGIASTGKGTSTKFMVGTEFPANAKSPFSQHLRVARKLISYRRLAAKISERYGSKQAKQASEQHACTLELAKRVKVARAMKKRAQTIPNLRSSGRGCTMGDSLSPRRNGSIRHRCLAKSQILPAQYSFAGRTTAGEMKQSLGRNGSGQRLLFLLFL